MQLAFPWLLSRRRLIVAAWLDFSLFVGLYYDLYRLRFDMWPGFSLRLVFLLVIWSLGSYVMGRYVSGAAQEYEPNLWSFVVEQLIGTGFVLFITLMITVTHTWLFSQNPVQASFRSFFLPFLGSLALFSPLVQLLLCRVLECHDTKKYLPWTYIGSNEGYQYLQSLLEWSRVRVRLDHLMPCQLHAVSTGLIVVDCFYEKPHSFLKSLYQFQQNGSIVLTRLSWCEVVLQRFPGELLTQIDLLGAGFSMPANTLQSRLKRLGDVAVASCLLLLTSPLILISALLIKASDGGPIFYSQIRTGLNGVPFKIWKLRSMGTDSESDGVRWSSRSDPRVTAIGSVLRRTRLDELPQLWCVLTGTMSLIGPRPERPEFDEWLVESIPYYSLRQLIRPGLSGWAQVNYPYGASIEDSANKLSYDLYYLKNFSFFLDLLILVKTIRLVFNGRGALPVSRG